MELQWTSLRKYEGIPVGYLNKIIEELRRIRWKNSRAIPRGTSEALVKIQKKIPEELQRNSLKNSEEILEAPPNAFLKELQRIYWGTYF